MNQNLKRKLIAGLFVPAIGLAAGSALAQSTPAGSDRMMQPNSAMPMANPSAGTSWDAQMFDRLDKNRDGRISREEAQGEARMKDSWSKLDSMNRGSVSKEEFEKYRMTQSGGAGTTLGSSPPPNSGSATPSTTNPATTPSSGMTPK